MRKPSEHCIDAELDALLLKIIQRFHEEGPSVFTDHRLVDDAAERSAENQSNELPEPVGAGVFSARGGEGRHY